MEKIAEAIGLIKDHKNDILHNISHDCLMLTECGDEREEEHLMKLINDRVFRLNKVTGIINRLSEYHVE